MLNSTNMNQHGQQPVNILMIEDNPGDIRLTQEALKEARLGNNLYVMKNGQEGLDFLLQREPHQDAPRPDLVLLDLNLPGIDGREVLAQIKNHESLKMIPVVVLTSSAAEEDILKSYGLHANCYIVKPLDFDKFAEIVKHLENFWLSIVALPPS